MKLGTKSLLFGVHQFLWHPITVLWAWRKLYGAWPNWWETIAILCHDLGYWGKPDMDGEEGREHPYGGAKLAAFICRSLWHCFHPSAPNWGAELVYDEVFDFTLGHSRELAKRRGVAPSRLCWADKYCVCVEPRWMYLLRAKASGEIHEYMANAEPIMETLQEIIAHRWFYGAYQITAEEYWLNWYRNKVCNLPEIKAQLEVCSKSCLLPL